ncbi:flavin reductase family protein [Pectinatus sottacetonis]|uniref:flavin reductase family protein n=1 Tax=Pectinatus sottacetonis TaxID=1002795 RepID=UPI001E2A0F37|nr:flavin reductase family protein [Pectinatus sottacetonis]
MKPVNPLKIADKITQALPPSVFLTTAYDGKINTMAIGWGSIGVMWSKPVFTAMVRKSRYTWSLLEKSNEFTISIPTHDMKTALSLCGTKSGRDLDKFKAAGLSAQNGQKINTPVIAGAGLHLECTVLYKQNMLPEKMDVGEAARWYKDNDWHTMYFAEIKAAYED